MCCNTGLIGDNWRKLLYCTKIVMFLNLRYRTLSLLFVCKTVLYYILNNELTSEQVISISKNVIFHNLNHNLQIIG